MKINKLIISNILSIKDASISFETNGLVLVEGWNHDADRANGAGKSAIFNALSFALFEKLPRKITASEILHRGEKSGFVEVQLSIGQSNWIVKRFRPKNVEFYRDGQKLNINQQEFESMIRMSYDQFILTIYNAQSNANSARFISSSDTDKKSFLLQLLNMDSFSDIKKTTDDKIKSLTSQIDAVSSQINSIESKIDAYSESLIDELELDLEISKIDNVVNGVNKEIRELSLVEKPDFSKFKQLEDDITQKQSKVYEAKHKLASLHDKYKELLFISEKKYDSNARCQECGSSLDTPEARSAHEATHEKTSLKLDLIKSQMSELDLVVSKESSLKDLASKLREKKSAVSTEYQSAFERISELKSFLNISQSKKTSLMSKKTANSDLKSKISNLSELREKHLSDKQQKMSTLEVYKALSAIFAPTGAQAYILDSVVESFNDIVQKYVDIVWPNVSYQLQSQRETAKGDIVAKLAEVLTMDGKQISVGSLSGGELRALSLCIDFALLEVLASRFGISLNPIILDEPFDGLDSSGREVVISLLSSLSKDHQILVVDHASESKVLFSKVIRVEKRNGVSSINIDS